MTIIAVLVANSEISVVGVVAADISMIMIMVMVMMMMMIVVAVAHLIQIILHLNRLQLNVALVDLH